MPVRLPLGDAEGLTGEVDDSGTLVAAAEPQFQAGMLVASVGGLTAEARVRIIGDLPWEFDFDGLGIAEPAILTLNLLR